MEKHIIHTFPLEQHLAFLKDLFFVFISFALVTTSILVSLLENRSIHYNKLSITYNYLSISSFSYKLNFHVCFILLDWMYISKSLKN